MKFYSFLPIASFYFSLFLFDYKKIKYNNNNISYILFYIHMKLKRKNWKLYKKKDIKFLFL